MSWGMVNSYGNILFFLLGSLAFVFTAMSLVRLLAPRRPSPEKNSTYECGEEPIGSGWINFNARFYLIAILFIVFDVEIVLILPVIVNFRAALLDGRGVAVFAELLLFTGVLFIGLVYAWSNGHLEWLRDVRSQLRVEGPVVRLKDLLRAEDRGRGEEQR